MKPKSKHTPMPWSIELEESDRVIELKTLLSLERERVKVLLRVAEKILDRLGTDPMQDDELAKILRTVIAKAKR